MNNNAELSIKGESIQSLYGSYLKESFLVNRRYQRKLIWTVEEKKAFIESIIRGYPVPLILFAEINDKNGKKFEIIDGMQRMNAIMSFVEQEFDIDGKYFNLDTMADTKFLKDSDLLIQKGEPLDRQICADFVRYPLPLSIFQESQGDHVDEVFRRLNSGGRHLSKQELRQAGALSKFANIVRKLASNIRGDSSARDVLDLKLMKTISVTNKNLDYGIPVESIFWVENNIITKEKLRESQDEEVIADIVAWVVTEDGLRSSSDILDQLYGFNIDDPDEATLANNIELQIQKINEDILISNIQSVFDTLIDLIARTDSRNLNTLLFPEGQQSKISRFFQIIFYSFYELLIKEDLEIINERELLNLMKGAGGKIITLAAGGGNWSQREKQTQTDAFVGVIRKCFGEKKIKDNSRNQWITRFENLLMQSATEQTMYDFKVGLHALTENSKFDTGTFSQIIKTLTAMANTFPNTMGYCILGVADTKESAERYEKVYKNKNIIYSNFLITGIQDEAILYHNNLDKYFTKLTQLIKQQPISDRDKDYLSRNIRSIRYFDKDIIILQIESGDIPSIYDESYYVRHGSNINEVEAKNYGELFSRFVSKS